MALGMIECFGFVTSIVVADKAAKTAPVEIVAIDKNKPANAEKCEVPRVMVVKIEGDVASVEAATMAGVDEAKKRGMYITHKIIPRQSEEIEWFARLNALGRNSTI